jgi:hypothetical protein
METSHLALVQGWRDTRTTLVAWNERPWPVLRRWLVSSSAIGVGLLFAVCLVAELSPAHGPVAAPAQDNVGTMADVVRILLRNSLVLALHALACVAGFIARSSLPLGIERRRGISRAIHEQAGPLAIAAVVGATAFSLCAQAYLLGTGAATLAAGLRVSPPLLLLAVTPHALPELTALFLPLAAWIAASRRGDWHQLLAATFATVAIAVPVLIIAAMIEVYVSPHLLNAVAG